GRLELRAARYRRVAPERVGERLDVRVGRAAAAADDADAELLDEDALVAHQLLGRERVEGALGADNRQAGVGQYGDRPPAVLAEVADVLAHLRRAGGT